MSAALVAVLETQAVISAQVAVQALGACKNIVLDNDNASKLGQKKSCEGTPKQKCLSLDLMARR